MAEGTAVRKSTRTIVCDTTLRDGEQTPGACFSPGEKAEYVERAEAFGVRYFDVGFPQNRFDFEASRAAVLAAKSARIGAMAIADRKSIGAVAEIGAHEVLLAMPASKSHVDATFGGDIARALRTMASAIDFARSVGLAVNIGLIDAGRRDTAIIDAILRELATRDDVSCVTVADTRGELLPCEVPILIQRVLNANLGLDCRIAFHAHNDLGLATANSIAALESHPRVDHVHATFGGYGERAGNAALEQIALIAQSRLLDSTRTHFDLSRVRDLADYVDSMFLAARPRHAPATGANVCTHESGIHQSATFMDPTAFQFVAPESIGRETTMVLGKHSGRHLVERIAQAAQVEPDLIRRAQSGLVARDKEPLKRRLREIRAFLDDECFIGLKSDCVTREILLNASVSSGD